MKKHAGVFGGALAMRQILPWRRLRLPKDNEMIKLGDYNKLTVTRFTDHGAYLDGGDELGEILMPKAYVTDDMHPGDEVEVFVYLDQSNKLVATLETPLARVGDFAWLRVAWVNEYGAFLDWGLMKDLFVPFREQKVLMQQGRWYMVHVHVDEETSRIVASAKVERYFTEASGETCTRGQEMEVTVYQRSPLGYKVVADNKYSGLLYADQVYGEEPRPGDCLTATVVNVRPDGKLDLSLQSLGTKRFRDFSEVLLDELRAAGGTLPFTDKSSPVLIETRFRVSKKTFKRAVGTLYRQRLITLSDAGISLAPPKKPEKPQRPPRRPR